MILQDSGIEDINIHDDNNVSSNVDSGNKLNAVDVIELISDDEDDANDLISIEIQDDVPGIYSNRCLFFKNPSSTETFRCQRQDIFFFLMLIRYTDVGLEVHRKFVFFIPF